MTALARSVVLGLLAALYLGAAGHSQDEAAWIRVETDHFELLSQVSREGTLTIGSDLEGLHAVLSGLNPGRELLSPLPTRIYLFRDRTAFAPFLPGPQRREDGATRTAGYFHTAPLGNFVALDAGARRLPSEILYHEYLHYVARHNLPHLPLWFNEGLAEYYSTFETTEDEAVIGLPLPQYQELLRTRDLLSFDRLTELDQESRDYHGGDRRGLFYAQSWAIVHWLLSEPSRVDAVRSFLARLADGQPAEEALLAALDGQEQASRPQSIERALEEHLSEGVLPHYRIARPDTHRGRAAVDQVPPAWAHYYLGDLQLALSHTDEAWHHFEAALELMPEHGLAHAGIGRLQEAGGALPEALFWYEEAARLAPDEPLPALLLGTALLRSVAERGVDPREIEGEDLATLRLARQWLEHSTLLAPDFGPAWARLGASWMIDPEPSDDGAAALRRAARLDPPNAEVRYHLAVLLARLGHYDDAHDVLDHGLEPLDRPELLRRAHTLVAREQMRPAEKLAEAGRPDEAIAAAQRVWEEAQNEEVRAMVAAQMERLEQVGNHNRAVFLLNEATRLARAGEIDQALELLEDLRRSSADSELRRRGRELARALEQR